MKAALWPRSFMPSRPAPRIVFQTPRVEPQYGTDLLSANAQAVKDLQAQHVQIIVDDIGVFGVDQNGQLVTEPGDPKGAFNGAIDDAVKAGISYFSAAGNLRVAANGLPALNIFGHNGNPHAVTVADRPTGWRFTRSAVAAGPVSAADNGAILMIGANSSKPDVTAPDGGPTSLLLPPGSTLDPFFGTSAAAPAAAAIAALMMQANPQLKNNPRRLANFMEFTAISDGESASKQGFGFLNGPGGFPTRPHHVSTSSIRRPAPDRRCWRRRSRNPSAASRPER